MKPLPARADEHYAIAATASEHPWLVAPGGRGLAAHTVASAIALFLLVAALDTWLANAVRTALLWPGSFQWHLLLAVQAVVDWPLHVIVVASLLLLTSNGLRLATGYLAPIAVTTGLVHLAKYAIGRARPELELGALAFQPGSNPLTKFDSFPSGHATCAFVTLTLLGLYFPRFRWYFWGLGSGLALMRVAQGMHFTTDVVAGALLGLGVVAGCVRLLGPAFYGAGAVADDASRSRNLSFTALPVEKLNPSN